MDKDYYAGGPTVEEQLQVQNSKPKKPINIVLIILLALIVILIIVFLVATLNKTTSYEELETNNFLKSLKITGGSVDKEFDKKEVRYQITTSENFISLSCELESSKAKIENCEDFEVNSNDVKHQIKVTAENGNVKIYYLRVFKLVDQPVRIINVTGVPEKWGMNDITFTVHASADKGLHAQAYSFDGGLSWTSSANYTTAENKVFKIIVRDVEENQTPVKDVYINKIDKTKPEVSLTGVVYQRKANLFASVTPGLTASGYTYKWYRNNQAVSGNAASLEAKLSGTYHVVVTTGAGAVTQSNSFEVNLQ